MSNQGETGTAPMAPSERAVKKTAAAQEKSGQARRRQWRICGATLAVTAALLVIMFVAEGLYPFGEKVLRYADGDQSFGLIGYVQSTFFSDNNLLYSWSTVLGGNMMGTWAFYSASPFNLLTVFFADNLVLGYHVILLLKFLAAALCFSIMLQWVFPSADAKLIVLFSSCYPFIGYMTYYIWNQSWMDGVILLPLVALGIWQILRCRRPLLYIAALALSLLSNYYTGYMICLASVLLLAGGAVLTFRSLSRDLMWTVVWYAVATAVAAALAAALLLPTYRALPEDRELSLQELFEDVHYDSTPQETLSMLFTGSMDDMTWATVKTIRSYTRESSSWCWLFCSS